MELASAFFKVTIPKYLLLELRGSNLLLRGGVPGIVKGASIMESQGDIFSCSHCSCVNKRLKCGSNLSGTLGRDHDHIESTCN
jgi:hypothetical protein